jgi:histidyl-tRNA synthetase
MQRRNYIFDTIRRVFRKYGFEQIETPAMENLVTLTGKYGEEGDQLLFKIINSRLHEASNKKELSDEFSKMLDKNLNSPLLTERALRYDLTVPFARYVVMHRNEIQFPFRRYQIQPVWRADKPQKGRYREFYQCDADVIGSNSLMNEVDLVLMMKEIFESLGINSSIHINNRKILTGIAEITNEADKITAITIAIDKLDKIGADKVIEELRTKNVSENAIDRIKPLIGLKGSNIEKSNLLRTLLRDSETGLQGVNEVEFVLQRSGVSDLVFDITLARGLNYYTGAIFEVKASDVQIGSICGGGRYDDLTGIFGMPGISGVGVSFGVDRISDVMEELNIFKNLNLSETGTKVLIINFGDKEEYFALELVKNLRRNGISSELYPDPAKMKKQLSYADDKKIPFVILAGSQEIADGKPALKNMITGEQTHMSVDDLISFLK